MSPWMIFFDTHDEHLAKKKFRFTQLAVLTACGAIETSLVLHNVSSDVVYCSIQRKIST